MQFAARPSRRGRIGAAVVGASKLQLCAAAAVACLLLLAVLGPSAVVRPLIAFNGCADGDHALVDALLVRPLFWMDGDSAATATAGVRPVHEVAAGNLTAITALRDYVMESRPVVVRGGAAALADEAARLWSDEWLAASPAVGGAKVRVESVPAPYARFGWFMPGFAEERRELAWFLGRYRESGRPRNYYMAEGDVPEELARRVARPRWTEAMAVERFQWWLGTGGTQSLPHTDGYDNVLVQVDGSKVFRLVSPTERALLATPLHGSDVAGVEVGGERVTLPVGYSPIDFFDPDFDAYPQFADARVFEVTVNPGDVLLLPAVRPSMSCVPTEELRQRYGATDTSAAASAACPAQFWWHHVRNLGELDERTMAFNWWFAPHALLDAAMGAMEDGAA